MSYYSQNFDESSNKKEFVSTTTKKKHIYQEPHQLLLRNVLSKHTPYENMLLYHNLGSGKSCTAISIAEGFKESIYNLGRKIVVLVKNKNIQKNFVNELASKCAAYFTEEQRRAFFGTKLKEEYAQKMHKILTKHYQFYTYGAFVNKVIGTKDFEKDEFGRNTTKVKRRNGKIVRKPITNPITNLNNTVVIVDEAHNITNNDVYIALHEVLSRSYNTRLVLLTATPLYDNVKEIFELANLLNVQSTVRLPIRNELLKSSLVTKLPSEYTDSNVLTGGILNVTREGMEMLKNAFQNKVSHVNTNIDTNPTPINMGSDLLRGRKGTTKVVYCEMSDYQYEIYKTALQSDLNRFGTSLNKNVIDIVSAIEANENEQEIEVSVSKSSSLYKNSNDASTMVYPNKSYGKDGFLNCIDTNGQWKENHKHLLTTELKTYSCKLYTMLQNIYSSKGTAFIYSNYVSNGGTSLIKYLLLQNGFKEYKGQQTGNATFAVFDDSLSAQSRERIRRVFNSPENKKGDIIKILIGSPIISEGVTLKNVRQLHILEPSWNMSRVNQIIGRVIRNYSHYDLNENERTVEIYKYVAIYNSQTDFYIDKEKYVLSEEKDRANKKVERLLKEISFDCNLLKNRNELNTKNFMDDSPECDYTHCKFNCNNMQNQKPVDSSTYDLYINFFDKHDIDYVTKMLEDMFKTYFVWSLDDIIAFIKNQSENISREAIFTALNNIVSDKLTLQDMHEREGYIIKKGPYYIFNPSSVDPETSLFSKMLDFTINKNKYTFEEYIKLKGLRKSPKYKEPVKKVETSITLSKEDIDYNMNIINNSSIFGTYRQRGNKDNIFGPKDKKFRIVDLRDTTDEEDKRKQISGMWVGSFKKPKLLELAKHLEISVTNDLDKEQLGAKLEKHLLEINKVLK